MEKGEKLKFNVISNGADYSSLSSAVINTNSTMPIFKIIMVLVGCILKPVISVVYLILNQNREIVSLIILIPYYYTGQFHE